MFGHFHPAGIQHLPIQARAALGLLASAALHAPEVHSEQFPSLSHRIVVVPSVTLTALPSVETLAFAASPPLPVK